jgi:ribosomal protein S18 acetylase RimI-like enzyme
MHAMTTKMPGSPGPGSEVRDAAISTLVAAFEDDVAVRTIYPGDLDYRRHFAGFLTVFGGRAFEAGVVDLDPAGRGAALWFPPGLAPDDGAIMAHLEASVPPERLPALAGGMEAQGRLHPSAPHWYLPWIGVRPGARSAGVGSELLARGLARADAEGMPAYLEATSERNAALYLRHGFQVLSILAMPGYPEIIAMWRPAQNGLPSAEPDEITVPACTDYVRRGLLARLFERIRERRRRASTYRTLLEFDDHMLDDIGLKYSDVVTAQAARKPIRRTQTLWSR